MSIWIESTFGLRNEDDRIVRATPAALDGPGGGAAQLEAATGVDFERCRDLVRAQLMAGYEVINPTTGFPVFAFRLHQFLSRGDTVYASPELPKDRYSTLERQRFVPGDRSRASAAVGVLPCLRSGLLRRQSAGSPDGQHVRASRSR